MTEISKAAQEAAKLELKDNADWIPGHDRPNPYGTHVQAFADAEVAKATRELTAEVEEAAHTMWLDALGRNDLLTVYTTGETAEETRGAACARIKDKLDEAVRAAFDEPVATEGQRIRIFANGHVIMDVPVSQFRSYTPGPGEYVTHIESAVATEEREEQRCTCDKSIPNGYAKCPIHGSYANADFSPALASPPHPDTEIVDWVEANGDKYSISCWKGEGAESNPWTIHEEFPDKLIAEEDTFRSAVRSAIAATKEGK